MPNFICDDSAIKLSPNILLDALPCAIGIKNNDSIYVGTNQRTATLTGFAKNNDMLGISDDQLNCAAAEFHEEFKRQDQEALAGKKLVSIDVNRYADGYLHVFLSTKMKIFDASNNPFVLFTMTEIPVNSLLHVLGDLTQRETHQNSNILGCYYIQNLPRQNSHTSKLALSEKQSECLFYLTRGKTAKEIAKLLKLSFRTIEAHTNSLKNIFGCATKSELLDKAFQLGFARMIPPSLVKELRFIV